MGWYSFGMHKTALGIPYFEPHLPTTRLATSPIPAYRPCWMYRVPCAVRLGGTPHVT